MTSRRERARRATSSSTTPARLPGASRPAVLTLRGSGDLVVATPYLLGFRPESSLVLVATAGPRRRTRVTVRVDLPPEPLPGPELGPYLAGLRDAAVRAGAEQVSLLVYPAVLEDPALHDLELPRRDLVEALRTTCLTGGLAVTEALCVVATDDGQDRYWSYLCSSEHCCPREGKVTDERSGTDVRLAFVSTGRAPRRDRADLVASLAPAAGSDPAALVLNTAVACATRAFVEQVAGTGPTLPAALCHVAPADRRAPGRRPAHCRGRCLGRPARRRHAGAARRGAGGRAGARPAGGRGAPGPAARRARRRAGPARARGSPRTPWRRWPRRSRWSRTCVATGRWRGSPWTARWVMTRTTRSRRWCPAAWLAGCLPTRSASSSARASSSPAGPANPCGSHVRAGTLTGYRACSGVASWESSPSRATRAGTSSGAATISTAALWGVHQGAAGPGGAELTSAHQVRRGVHPGRDGGRPGSRSGLEQRR